MLAATRRHGLVAYLLEEIPRDVKTSPEVQLTTPKGVIASRLSVTQEHFSRILHDLAARGLIEVRGRSIRIPNVDSLREFSD